MIYDVRSYGLMLADTVRMDAYERALRATIRPGCVVADIGTGPGIAAFMACRLGARRVYAIESNPVIDIGRRSARDNDLAGCVEFIDGLSTAIDLPERADVIVSDLRGVLPLFQQHIPSIADARSRLLASGGTLIPRQDSLWVAPVSSADHYELLVAPWRDGRLGLDLSAGLDFATNTFTKERISADELAAEPRCWVTLDYTTISNPNVRGNASWVLTRDVTVHGWCMWFDTILADGVGFSNAPGQPPLLYGSALFPVSEPIELTAGATLSVEVRANLIGDGYVWTWSTMVHHADGRTAAFRQSSFLGEPRASAEWRKRAAGYRPRLSEDGRIAAAALALMAEGQSVDEIADVLLEKFPESFASRAAALGRAGSLSAAYSG